MSKSRTDKLASLRSNNAFDVIVIGGGINGIGTFRDLSLQGLKVLLVELNDFCSGCSSAPSRMIHGGLRYLENGEFDLVKESLKERDALLSNAPHFVRPLPTLVPIRSVFSGLLNGAASFLNLKTNPVERGAIAIKFGLTLYDWVTTNKRLLPKHKFSQGRKIQKKWPELRDDIRFTATYHDAWINHPERLCIELINDAENYNSNAFALNYSELNYQSNSLVLTDKNTGKKITVETRAIVNATGAWVDQTVENLARNKKHENEQMVEGTKGSHLIINNSKLKAALNGHMIYFENSDGRVCILFPYLANVLVGSTDIRVSHPGRTSCEKAEQAYILQSLRYVFPNISIAPAEVVFTFSGIRPLPISDQTFTGRISRGHYVKMISGAIPQFCMIGGKWTTFRSFSEEITNDVLSYLEVKRKISTHDIPIGGGVDYPLKTRNWTEDFCKKFGVSQERTTHLLEHYGTNSENMLRSFNDDSSKSFIIAGTNYTNKEIEYLIKNEHVLHLSDLVFRRTDLAINGVISHINISEISAIMSRIFGWNTVRLKKEIKTLKVELSKYHNVSNEALNERSKIKGR